MFSHPLAFLALASIPALVAIYYLRNRFRTVPVSSLMFWQDIRPPQEGGRVFRRLPLPLLFFLEALALLALVTAAAAPHLLSTDAARPLVIVLDDSFSMLAGENNSPRHQGVEAVIAEASHSAHSSVTLVLAGEKPQVLGQTATKTDLAGLLAKWNCKAPTANLEEAVSFAFGLSDQHPRVLVVTDHAPATQLDNGAASVEWRAFGLPKPNAAFVNANWSGNKVLLEIANLSDSHNTTTFETEVSGPGSRKETASLSLGPREIKRVVLALPAEATGFRAELGEDALALDNRVTLLPPPRKPVRTEIRVSNEILKKALEQALEAAQTAVLTSGNPDLLICDNATEQPGNGKSWVLRIVSTGAGQSFIGPFVMNKTHPLCDGLNLGGVVWNAAADNGGLAGGGLPLLTLGDTKLMADSEKLSGTHDILMRYNVAGSNLLISPNWPILLENLLAWRSRTLAGLEQTNLRLGGQTMLSVAPETKTVRLETPAKQVQTLSVTKTTLLFQGTDVGIFSFLAEPASSGAAFRCSVNALAAGESDLTTCSSGTSGNWLNQKTASTDYKDMSWVFLLIAVLALGVHLGLATGSIKRFSTTEVN
ncbi:MAG: BatA and WFA domain-containing protein [Blastocatellia bacterium]|nr:BatA and WFA domain-containing protein [Blastocatellia bacterium]